MIRFVLVCEGPTDARASKHLCDRLCDERGPGWIDGIIESLREWRGIGNEANFTKWSQLKTIGKESGDFLSFRRPPDISNPGEYVAARRAITLAVLKAPDDVQPVVLLLRDTDCDPGVTEALVRAASDASSVCVVAATAHPMIEAWTIAGFQAESETEDQLLADLRQELGFHPCEDSHRLGTGNAPGGGLAKGNAKRVHSVLLQGDQEREARCLSADLDMLEQRGCMNGLASFFGEVRRLVFPLFEGRNQA